MSPRRSKRIKTAHAQQQDDTQPSTSGRGGEKRVPRSGPAFLEFQLPGNHRRLQKATQELFYGRHLSSLHENCLTWKHTDKCFAVAWVDHETSLWGTKCNKLLLMNLRNKQTTPLCQPPTPPSFPRPPVRDNLYGRCGVHNISFNPSRTLMVTGGENPNDALLYSVPDFRPLKNYMGHQDWVFQACWLDDESFVTGGRDGKLLVWKVNLRDPELLTDIRPAFTKDTKLGRCRDIGHAPSLSRICAVDPDTACIKLYDTHTWRQADKFSLPESSDAMCAAMRHDVIAVGSASKLSRFDPRMKLSNRHLSIHDHMEGLRSVQLAGNYVSCGSCWGTLTFLDLRTDRWLSVPSPGDDYATGQDLWQPLKLQTTKGYTDLEGVPPQVLHLYPHSHHSVYCHAWDDSGLRLLVGGGPLQFGLRGCYAALWQ